MRAFGKHRGGALLGVLLGLGPACPVGQSAAKVCQVGDIAYSEGTINPVDPCLTCQAALNDSDWTRTVGCGSPDAGSGPPDAGQMLPDASFCIINSTFVASGTPNPTEVCQVCDPSLNMHDWSGVGTGAACDGGYCAAGRCLYRCYIAGNDVPPGFDPSHANRCCNPAINSGSWLPAFSSGPSSAIASAPASGNIFINDGGSNGLPDVQVMAGSRPRPTWNVFHSVAPGQFGNGVVTAIQSSLSSVYRGLAGDLNGDHLTDLVIYGVSQSGSPTLVALMGQANGGFSSSTEYSMGAFPRSGGALADLRRFGLPDVVVGGSTLGVFLNQGDGSLASEHLVGPASSGNTLVVGDFNGDNFLDVATERDIYFGNGEGRFPTVGSGYGGVVLAAGDFNSDFISDLVVSDAAGSSVTVYLGNKYGTFSAAFRTPIANGFPYVASAADFNRDGLLDLLVVTTADNELLLGRGDGTFLPVAVVLGPDPVAALQAGDLNADGTPDVAVFETRNGGSWTPWFNNCP